MNSRFYWVHLRSKSAESLQGSMLCKLFLRLHGHSAERLSTSKNADGKSDADRTICALHNSSIFPLLISQIHRTKNPCGYRRDFSIDILFIISRL